MWTTRITFEDAEYVIYIIEHNQLFVLSIPEFGFSMQLEVSMTNTEMMDEITMHLFTLFDEESSVAVSTQIMSVIRNK